MTAREKKLLLAVLVVALYAVLDLGWSQVVGPWLDRMNRGADTQLAQTREAVTQSAAQIARMPLKAMEKTLLKRAETPLVRDPLTLPPDPAKKQGTARIAGVRLVYTGYLSIGQQVYAVINGTEYTTGETIAETGEVVRAITERTVTLWSEATGRERTLAHTQDQDDTVPEPAKE